MRPIRLEMTAFGPYRGTETVEFEKLGERNLFLITGPTGSGKTTIFDAITYALYGSGNGDERKPQNFRSDFADKDTETVVAFDFRIGGRIYSITRYPAQYVKKKRGDGYREESERAAFVYETKNGAKRVFDKIREVNEEVERTLGLNVKQFRQIMMIPQGQFREVITSDTNSREEILKALFDTDRYAHIQEHMKQKKKDLEKSMAESLDNIDNELEKIEKESSGMTTERVLEAIAGDVQNLEVEIELKKERIKHESESLKELNIKLAESVQHNKLLESLKDSQRGLEVLLGRADEYEEKKRKLLKSEKVRYILPEERGVCEAQNRLARIENAMNTGKQESDRLELELKLKTEQFKVEKEKEDEVRRCGQRISDIEENLGAFKDLEVQAVQLERGKNEHAKMVEAIVLMQREIEADRSRVEELERELEGCEDYSLEIERSKNRTESLKKSIDVLRKAYLLERDIASEKRDIRELESNISKRDEKVKSLEAKLQREEGEYSEMHEQLLAKQLYYIASNLEEGDTCPVCGSTEHPSLAKSKDATIGEEEIKLKKASLEELRKKLEMERTERGRLEGDLKGALTSVESKASVQGEKLAEIGVEREHVKDAGLELKEEIEKLKSMEVELRKSQLDADKKKEDVKRLKKSILELEKEQKQKMEAERELSDSLKELESKVENMRASLKKLIGETAATSERLENILFYMKKEHKDMEERYRRSEEELRSAEKRAVEVSSRLKAAEVERDETKKDLELKLERFWREIKKSGFSDEEEYRMYKLEDVEMEELSRDIESYNDSVKELESKIKRDKEAAGNRGVIDIESLKSLEVELVEAKEKLYSEVTGLSSKRDRYTEAIESIAKELKGIGKSEEEYRLVGELSAVANAEKGSINKKNMTFERYVLSSYLEDILCATNRRFKNMTDGRFEIFRKEGLDHRGKAGGLDLEVMDYYTGSRRDITTLSGGEGFKASLSMALGLSDVVKSYAGGIELDTIFIDEGFGTLDSDSLEMAIDTLVELQSTGRLVGIISHVEELKERIDRKIVIESSSKGSHIRDFE